LAVLLAAACTFLYLRLATELRAAVDSTLRSHADVLAAGIGQSGPSFGDTSKDALQEGQPFAQILNSAGHVMESSQPVSHTQLLPTSALRSLHHPSFFQRHVPGVEGTSRVYALAVTDEGQHVFLVVGASLSNRDEILSRFLMLFAIGGPAAIALASGAGWLIAGAGLRPVERMRRQAEAISVSDRSHRLPVASTGDEIARLGATLNAMLDRLQQSFDRERRFVDDASHELRTPLTILKTELDVALSRPRSPTEMEAALRSASEEADRLAALARDLLAYSTVEGGRLPVHPEPVQLDQLLQDVSAALAPRAAAAGVTLTASGPALAVVLDASRLRQALDNLLDNAIRHTPPGGWIRVAAAQESSFIRLEVEDSGPGFDPDLLLVAFEPFTRGAADRSNAPTGAGLGLAIVQAVALAHDGQASIENGTTGGAKVTVRVRASA
jgi:heavy metal sensor kinase